MKTSYEMLISDWSSDVCSSDLVLSLTIIIMAISTFCIGLIPSYHTIGLWAPILLLLCKLAQGFSVGGEYTGAAIFVAEYAPDRQRGFLGSRSEEHTSELQSLMRISYAVFCLKKKTTHTK